MYYDKYKGVYFVEGCPVGAKLISEISTQIEGYWITQAQLKTLDDVKDAMIAEVVRQGGNSVVDFKYCQKSSFWRSLISIDDVRWEASGHIARIDPMNLQ